MQELLFGPLLLTWGPRALDYASQHPWRLFAAVLAFALLMDLMFSKRSRGNGDASAGDFGGADCGGGDGGCD